MTKIPIVYWSRLFLDLEPYLTERNADGVPIITFFHRQFNEVQQKRYGLVEVWNIVIRTCLHRLQGHKGTVTSVSVTIDGQQAVSGSDDHL